MKLTTVLFDLDGTLLPMDQDLFAKAYFGLLAQKLAPRGYDPKELVEAVWSGTAEMVKNTGEMRNEDVFWKFFTERYGERVKQDLPLFDEFYRTDFVGAKSACGYNPQAAETVAWIRGKGLRVALATNPIFPAVATEHRIRWAGLTPDVFELYTTYENSSYCKPNPDYYREVAARLGVQPEECLMVGNDALEDMVAETLGMKVFLLTDCLINKGERDISRYPQGDFSQLLQFVKELMAK